MPNTSTFARRTRTLQRLAAAGTLATGLAGAAVAQTSPAATSAAADGASPPAASPSSGSSTQWGLGVFGGVFQQPYEGVSNKKRALPMLYVENAWLRIAGPSADLKLGQWSTGYGAVELAARLKYEGLGYEASDSPVLAGMDERKESFWAGGAVAWSTPVARLGLEWLGDVSSHSKGQQLQLQLDRRFGFGRWAVTPRVQAQWLDKKYVDYYYGVKASEAVPGRAQYTGKAATTLGLGVRVDYQLAARQSVFLDVSATSLPGEIKDSPLVGRSSVSRASIGYLYRF